MPPVFGCGEDRASSSPLSPRSEHFEFTRVDVVSVAIGRQAAESDYVVVCASLLLASGIDTRVLPLPPPVVGSAGFFIIYYEG